MTNEQLLEMPAITESPASGEVEKRAARTKQGKILRYSIDVISVAVVVGTVAVQFTAYYYAWAWYTLPIILLGVRALHLIEHNHTHLRIFRQNFLNEILGYLFFISNGVAVDGYYIYHVQNHHRYAQKWGGKDKDYDWSSTFGFHGCSYPDKPMNRIYYSLTYGPIAIMQCLIEFMRMPGTPIFWSFVRSTIVFFAASGVMIALDPWNWFLFFGIPMILVWLSLGNNNYDHHIGCDMEEPIKAARVNLRFPYKLFGFNIGYHVEHHMKPTLHWSLLPKFHEAHKPEIPEKNYVLPRFKIVKR
jgi:beta-carotene hydroxylase